MIQRNVVHYRDPGLEKCNRTVALVHLTDKHVACADPGAGKRRVHVDEVLHIRAVHDRRAPTSTMQNPPDHADSGGLTARTGDTNSQGCTVKELGKKPRASSDGDTNTARGLHVRDRLLNSGGGHQDLLGSSNTTAVLRMKQQPTRT